MEPASELSGITAVFSSIMGWFGSFLTTVTSHPVLMIGIAVFLVGAVIGLVYRAVHGR